jgi:hypothetical protein
LPWLVSVVPPPAMSAPRFRHGSQPAWYAVLLTFMLVGENGT